MNLGPARMIPSLFALGGATGFKGANTTSSPQILDVANVLTNAAAFGKLFPDHVPQEGCGSQVQDR